MTRMGKNAAVLVTIAVAVVLAVVFTPAPPPQKSFFTFETEFNPAVCSTEKPIKVVLQSHRNTWVHTVTWRMTATAAPGWSSKPYTMTRIRGLGRKDLCAEAPPGYTGMTSGTTAIQFMSYTGGSY